MICPKCDAELDGYIRQKWGDGIQRQSVAPFICSFCASLLLIDLETNALTTEEQFKDVTGLDFNDLYRPNKKLWKQIEESRKLILSTPGRRPVLR